MQTPRPSAPAASRFFRPPSPLAPRTPVPAPPSGEASRPRRAGGPPGVGAPAGSTPLHPAPPAAGAPAAPRPDPAARSCRAPGAHAREGRGHQMAPGPRGPPSRPAARSRAPAPRARCRPSSCTGGLASPRPPSSPAPPSVSSAASHCDTVTCDALASGLALSLSKRGRPGCPQPSPITLGPGSLA